MKIVRMLSGAALLLGGVAGCFSSESKTTVAAAPAPAKPGRPQAAPVATIPADSAAAFVSRAKRIARNKKANQPFRRLDYNKVIAYDYSGGKGYGILQVIADGKFASTIVQQKALTQTQADDLTRYAGAQSTYGGGRAACFDPHLGLVFYKDDKVVQQLSVCLECNYLISTVAIPALEAKRVKIGDHYEYFAAGFSKSGRQKLSALCQQLGFHYCVCAADQAAAR